MGVLSKTCPQCDVFFYIFQLLANTSPTCSPGLTRCAQWPQRGSKWWGQELLGDPFQPETTWSLPTTGCFLPVTALISSRREGRVRHAKVCLAAVWCSCAPSHGLSQSQQAVPLPSACWDAQLSNPPHTKSLENLQVYKMARENKRQKHGPKIKLQVNKPKECLRTHLF